MKTATELIAEAREGDFEDRGWMIDIIDGLVDALERAQPEQRPNRDELIEAAKQAWGDQTILRRGEPQYVPPVRDDGATAQCIATTVDAVLAALAVPATPDKAALVESLRVAMLGTTDGGFIPSESDIPAGEMFRLAGEWVEANAGRFAVPATGEVEWEYGHVLWGEFFPTDDEETARIAASLPPVGKVARRRKAGPWVEVTP